MEHRLMTLDEAIAECEGVMRSSQTNVLNIEAEQVAEWLKEYRRMRTFVRTLERCAEDEQDITLFGVNYVSEDKVG